MKPAADRRPENNIDLRIEGFACRKSIPGLRGTEPLGPAGGAKPGKLHVAAPDEMHDDRLASGQRPRVGRNLRQRERNRRRLALTEISELTVRATGPSPGSAAIIATPAG